MLRLHELPPRRLELPLVVDLFKGRPFGSSNVEHKYLMKLWLPNGTFIRIYPPKGTTEDENGKFIWPEKDEHGHKFSLGDYINEKLYGYKGTKKTTDPRTGAKLLRAVTRVGALFEYEPIWVAEHEDASGKQVPGHYRFKKHERLPRDSAGRMLMAIEYHKEGFVPYLGKQWKESQKLTALVAQPKDVRGRGYMPASMAGEGIDPGTFKPESSAAVKTAAGTLLKPVAERREAMPELQRGDHIKLPGRGWVTIWNVGDHTIEVFRQSRTGKRSKHYNINTDKLLFTKTGPGRFHGEIAPVVPPQAPGAATAVGRGLFVSPKKPEIEEHAAIKEGKLAEFAATSEDRDPKTLLVGALTKKGTLSADYFKPEDIVKFRSEAELADEVREHPVSTAMTLGQVTITGRTTKLQNALTEEWERILYNYAGGNFAAFRHTKTYDRLKHLDEVDPIISTYEDQKPTRLEEWKRKNLDDHVQNASLKLIELARNYDPEVGGTFQGYVTSTLKHHMQKMARRAAMSAHSYIDVLHEEDLEEAARRQGMQVAGHVQMLSPEEHYELEQVTAPARTSIYNRVQDLPDTLRRVLLAALWLDTPGRWVKDKKTGKMTYIESLSEQEEKARIRRAKDEREDDPEKQRRVDPVMGEYGWMRPFTGRNSITTKLGDTVTDPDTGAKINLAQMHRDTARAYVERWLTQGLNQIRTRVSVPIDRPRPTPEDLENIGKYGVTPRLSDTDLGKIAEKHGLRIGVVHRLREAAEMHELLKYVPDAEWRNRANLVNLTKEQRQMSWPELVAYAATGLPPDKVPRVLTLEGRALKRWLELESKLAERNFRGMRSRAQQQRMRSEMAPAGELSVPQPEHADITLPFRRIGGKDVTVRPIRHIISRGPRTGTLEVKERPIGHWVTEPTGPLKRYALAARSPMVQNITLEGPTKTGKPLIVENRPVSQPRGDAPIHPAVAFFSDTPNQELARKLGHDLRRIEAVGGGAGAFVSPNIRESVAQHEIVGHLEQHFQTLQRYGKLTAKQLGRELAEAQEHHRGLLGLGRTEFAPGAKHAEWKEAKDGGLTAMHEAAQVYHNLRLSRIAGASVAKDEANAAETFARLKTKVARVQPGIANLYQMRVNSGDLVDDAFLSDIRKIHERLTRESANKLSLLHFERKRRGTLKSMLWEPEDSFSLIKAFNDLRFNVARIAAEVE